MDELSKISNNSSISEVINTYIKRGFGSMTKNDFEVWIFHWLITNDSMYKGKSDFAISQYLKNPESKVKRLRYEAGLKYGNKTTEDYKAELKVAFKKTKCQGSEMEGKVAMSIPDKLLRQYLSDMLIEDGRFMDGSFNSNVVTMSAGNFVFVLEKLFLDDTERNDVISEAKKHIKEDKEMPKTISESLSQLGITLGKSVLEKIIGSSTDDVVGALKGIIQKCKK